MNDRHLAGSNSVSDSHENINGSENVDSPDITDGTGPDPDLAQGESD